MKTVLDRWLIGALPDWPAVFCWSESMVDASGKEISVNKYKNIAGVRCGLLVAQEPHSRKGEAAYQWTWVCDCGGGIVLQHGAAKITGHCGCLTEARLAQRNVTHGMHRSREYCSWAMMKARCTNPLATHYCEYGGRGISVCEQWSESFEAFINDMGLRPAGTTLDRWPDGNGNYGPGNCRWATRKEQAQNRRDNVIATINGETKCLKEWCEIYQRSYSTVRNRLKRGVAIMAALTATRTRRVKQKETVCQA